MPEGKASPETLKLQKKYDNDPNSRVFVRLADSYLKDKLKIVALEIAIAGVEIHPKYIQGLIVLAKCYDSCGNINKSIETFDTVLDIDPENFFALKNAGKNYYKIGNKIKALELYKTLFDLSPFDDKLQGKIEQIEEEINTSPENVGFFKESIDKKNLSKEDIDLPLTKTEKPVVEEIKKDQEADTLNLIIKDVQEIEKNKSQELKNNEALTFLEQELKKLDSEKFYTEDTSPDQRKEIKTELSSTSEKAQTEDEVLEKAITDDELLDFKTLVEDEEYLKDSKIDFGQSPEIEKDDKLEKEIFGIKYEKSDEKSPEEISEQNQKVKKEIKQEKIQSDDMISKEVEELEKELEDSLSGAFEKPLEKQKEENEKDKIIEKVEVEKQEIILEEKLPDDSEKPLEKQKEENEKDKIIEKVEVEKQEIILEEKLPDDSEKPLEEQKGKIEDDKIIEKVEVDKQEKIPEEIPSYNGEIRSITMAKIYEEQGNIDKAIKVYKSLLDEHSEVNEDIKRLESILKLNKSTGDKKDMRESIKDEPTKIKGIDEFKNWLDSIE